MKSQNYVLVCVKCSCVNLIDTCFACNGLIFFLYRKTNNVQLIMNNFIYPGVRTAKLSVFPGSMRTHSTVKR